MKALSFTTVRKQQAAAAAAQQTQLARRSEPAAAAGGGSSGEGVEGAGGALASGGREALSAVAGFIALPWTREVAKRKLRRELRGALRSVSECFRGGCLSRFLHVCRPCCNWLSGV